jgi:hypothetical protein
MPVSVSLHGVTAGSREGSLSSPLGCLKAKLYTSRFLLLVLAFSLLAMKFAEAQTPAASLISGLSFGTISTRTTINYWETGAAQFRVDFPNYSGSPSVSVVFTLPSALTDGYGDNLPIFFSSRRNYLAAYNVGNSSLKGAVGFDPSNGLINYQLSPSSHTDYFWLGGTVIPNKQYVAATYYGDVTVTVTVTVGTQLYTTSLTIPITVTLQGNVSLSATGSLDFGLIVAGTTTPLALSPRAGNAPKFTASASGGITTVTYSSSISLNDGYGNTLTFIPSVYGSSSDNQDGATPILSGQSLGGIRTYYFWLGGSLEAVPPNQAPGNYTGTFVLTVTH